MNQARNSAICDIADRALTEREFSLRSERKLARRKKPEETEEAGGGGNDSETSSSGTRCREAEIRLPDCVLAGVPREKR